MHRNRTAHRNGTHLGPQYTRCSPDLVLSALVSDIHGATYAFSGKRFPNSPISVFPSLSVIPLLFEAFPLFSSLWLYFVPSVPTLACSFPSSSPLMHIFQPYLSLPTQLLTSQQVGNYSQALWTSLGLKHSSCLSCPTSC